MAEIESLPVRRCSRCKRIYLEDDRMYEDVNRCPFCGQDLSGGSDLPDAEIVTDRI